MADVMMYLVSYDITDDKRRTRMSDGLLNYGVRVQKSVFECLVTDRQVKAIESLARQVVDDDNDSVRIYRLCKRCADSARVVGTGDITDDLGSSIV